MKVIYFLKPFFADCDFPLIKEMQDKGVDVRCYMPLYKGFKSSSILDFNTPYMRFGLYRAANLEEFSAYRDLIDLQKLYIISPYSIRKLWLPGLFLWLCVCFHMLLFRADIIHIDWQLEKYENILRLLRLAKKKIMTVHDPFQHVGVMLKELNEKRRIKCFKWADKLILLNKKQVDDFSSYYDIPKNKIELSKLGIYNSFSHVKAEHIKVSSKYILYFGCICEYKGVDDLLEAMKLVNLAHPEIKLIIAGSGEFYFNIKPYINLEYIEFRHRYIGIAELKALVENALFTVCPYKEATQSGVIQTAFALNCPVVATNVGALSEMIENGITGRLVPLKDRQLLSNEIIYVLDNPSLIDDMRENIKRLNKKNHSWGSIADNYINIYESVLREE